MSRPALSLLMLASIAPAQLRLLQAEDLPARRSAAAVLTFGLQALRGDDGEPRFRAALATAAECLPAGSNAHAVLDALRTRPEPPPALAAAAGELRDDLEFTPLLQAPLPEGVPGFTVLDEVELRHYPQYRMVRTSMKGGSVGAFWPLFRHIQSHDISMTTPVQIDFRADGDRERQHAMAFLYGSPTLGDKGPDGAVEVVDMPPTTVLTIGSRGYDRAARIDELRQRLTAWLDVHPEWQADGPMRMMGYNSPMVPEAKRCFEVQIPLRAATPPPATDATAPRESV